MYGRQVVVEVGVVEVVEVMEVNMLQIIIGRQSADAVGKRLRKKRRLGRHRCKRVMKSRVVGKL
jgi:hypothetical protein